MTQTATMFWLIPAEPYHELFRNLVRVLAKQFDAPRFEPHLTLCGADGRELLRRLQGAPITLRFDEVAWSKRFTKTLFIRFVPNRALRDLLIQLGGTAKAVPDPHLSLVYKHLPGAVKRELASAIKLPFRTVVFDRVVLMRCAAPTQNRRDVESWRKVAMKRLASNQPMKR